MQLQQDMVELLQKQKLSKSRSERIFHAMVLGKLSERISKSLLLILAYRGESVQEIEGCLQAIKKLEPPRRVAIKGLIDTCGTGGDQSHSINVSTLAALVMAGAGAKVAKHGNRSLSSKCGSSDLVEALGIRLDASPQKMRSAIKQCGIGYFHAPLYHPVFKKLQPLRKALRTRTIFNYLGPLINPVILDYQLIGVSKLSHIKIFAEILKKSKLRRALICSSEDGMDEISLSAPTRIAFVQKNRIQYQTWKPEQFSLKKAAKKHLEGGSVKANRAFAMKILTGKLHGPKRDIVILNSAAGLYTAGIAKNMRHGIRLAEQSIDSGRAYQALCGLRKKSNRA
ncbi:MAG: anthranilate phosphoribosyltransferase [Candidatus Omnitrophica bacterium]|nr:anthranilate phosphoribosyltransferase [Candidatus Omnitrophota bacterium]